MRNFDRDNRTDSRPPRFEKRSFGGPKKFGGDRERSFDKPRFGGGDRGGFGGRDGGKPMMHEAVCSECGNRCQVPFKPNGRKPIFCSTCFETQGGGKSNERTFDRPRFGGREERSGGNDRGGEKVNENLKEQLAEVNAKLDRILRMLGNTGTDKKPKEKISFDNGLDFGKDPMIETEDAEEVEEVSVEAAPKKTKAKTAKSFPKKAGKAKK